MKKLTEKIHIYKVSKPYKNWYSIMTDDGFSRDNIILVKKKQLLRVAFALIKMALFNKETSIEIYK